MEFDYINDLPEYPHSHPLGHTYVVSAPTSHEAIWQSIKSVRNTLYIPRRYLIGIS